MKEALYWGRTEDGLIRCELCPHSCVIGEGKHGRCGVRHVESGRLVASGYGCISSANLDPIEKKPLYHFLPSSMIFSIGGWGCNFSCKFCQNWSISQKVMLDGGRITPEVVVRKALECGSVGIAYTYNEPFIGMEFLADCAGLAREKKLVNVAVTNGFVQPGPAAGILPLLDALNIDLKSIDDMFYREQCGGRLRPVQDFIVQCVGAGVHVELTNLVIPGLNDSEDGFRQLAGWVAESAGRKVPLHLSAYHPDYKLSAPPTPGKTLETAYAICAEELDYVYIGNVRGRLGQDTRCPGCGHCLVERQGFDSHVTGLKGARCVKCGRVADMVMTSS